MAEGEWNAFRPLKHPITGAEYVPAAPQEPTLLEKRAIDERNMVQLRKALARRGVQSFTQDDGDDYHIGIAQDEEMTYGRDLS